MYTQYIKEAKDIAKNQKVNGKIMSINQLETLIKLTCRYDYCLPIKCLTVKQASAEITSVMNKVARGAIVERQKMYKYSDLMTRFMTKHANIYREVIER